MRRAIALFMMSWLSLQGFAAVAMPFCQHAMHDTAVSGSTANPHAHHMHGADALSKSRLAQGERGHGAGLDCRDCGVCHLACTPAAPSAVSAIQFDASHFYGERKPAFALLFIPDQPHHPPLRARI